MPLALFGIATLGSRLGTIIVWVFNIVGTVDLLNAFYQADRLGWGSHLACRVPRIHSYRAGATSPRDARPRVPNPAPNRRVRLVGELPQRGLIGESEWRVEPALGVHARADDEGSRWNPVTLVTPAVSIPGAKIYLMTNNNQLELDNDKAQRQEQQERGESHGQEQGKRVRDPRKRASSNEHTPGRVGAGVGGCAPAAPREGEGVDPRP